MTFSKKQFLLFFLLINTIFLQAQAPTIWAGSIDANYHQLGFFMYQNPFYSKMDHNDDQIIVGAFFGQTDFDIGPGVTVLNGGNYYNSTFVQKMGPTGTLLWVKSFANCLVNGFDYDEDNNIVITGYFNGTVDFDPGPNDFNLTSTIYRDQFIVKLDPQGNFVWAKMINAVGPISPEDLHIDESNNILLSGSYSDSADFDPGPNTFMQMAGYDRDAYLLKLNSAGDFLWVKSMGNVGQGDEIIHTITADSENNIYTGGSFHIAMDVNPGALSDIRTSNGWQDIFIQKLDSNGNFIWAHTFGSTFSELPAQISVDKDDNVILSGSQGDAFDADPTSAVDMIGLLSRGGGFFMTKYNSNGDYLWGHNIGEATDEQIGNFVIDTNNNILIIGTFQDTSDFYPGTTEDRLAIPVGTGDAYLLQLDSSGNYLWHQVITGSISARGLSVGMDDDANIYCLGAYEGTMTFPDNSFLPDLVTNGDTSLFVLKLGPFVNGIGQLPPEELRIAVYPNPTQDAVFIRKENDLTFDFRIINQMGQVLMEQTSSDRITKFDLSKLTTGVYYLSVKDKWKRWTTKIVKQ